MSLTIRLLPFAAGVLLVSSLAHGQGAAGDGQGRPAGPPPGPAAKTYEVVAQIDAGASLFAKWPSGGETWHHGVGFLDPFGTVEYFCGKNFPEARDIPLPEWGKGFFTQLTGRADPLFCVYRTKDGDFYVYDSVPGTLMRTDTAGRDLIMNVVVGGSGPYKGATGIWLGRTEGVAPRREVTPGRMGNETLLKIMTGYVKVPTAEAAPR